MMPGTSSTAQDTFSASHHGTDHVTSLGPLPCADGTVRKPLPTDVLGHLCGVMYDLDRHDDLARLMRVSRQTHELSARFVYRILHLNPSSARSIAHGLEGHRLSGLSRVVDDLTDPSGAGGQPEAGDNASPLAENVDYSRKSASLSLVRHIVISGFPPIKNSLVRYLFERMADGTMPRLEQVHLNDHGMNSFIRPRFTPEVDNDPNSGILESCVINHGSSSTAAIASKGAIAEEDIKAVRNVGVSIHGRVRKPVQMLPSLTYPRERWMKSDEGGVQMFVATCSKIDSDAAPSSATRELSRILENFGCEYGRNDRVHVIDLICPPGGLDLPHTLDHSNVLDTLGCHDTSYRQLSAEHAAPSSGVELRVHAYGSKSCVYCGFPRLATGSTVRPASGGEGRRAREDSTGKVSEYLARYVFDKDSYEWDSGDEADAHGPFA